MKTKRIIGLLLCLCLMATVLVACAGNTTPTEKKDVTASAEATPDAATKDSAAAGIDYMALVNKTHPLPSDWENNLKTIHFTNTVGDDVEVEAKAYDAYLELKAALAKEGVDVDLDSARRSVADQQRIMDDFTEQYGAEYAAKTVAKPGYSEHHTGLALDLYLIIDGKDVTLNEDMIQYPEIWEKIHALLPEYGFILRYLEGKEYITGYGYEPWHIRYIDNKETAKEITDKGITFEGYLGTASEEPVTIDCGVSQTYSEQELKDAVIRIECQFAFWNGFQLSSIRYAGDDAVTEEKAKELSESNKDSGYTQFAQFLMNFRTSDNVTDTGLTANTDYVDYVWILARNKDGGWDIVSQGEAE